MSQHGCFAREPRESIESVQTALESSGSRLFSQVPLLTEGNRGGLQPTSADLFHPSVQLHLQNSSLAIRSDFLSFFHFVLLVLVRLHGSGVKRNPIRCISKVNFDTCLTLSIIILMTSDRDSDFLVTFSPTCLSATLFAVCRRWHKANASVCLLSRCSHRKAHLKISSCNERTQGSEFL